MWVNKLQQIIIKIMPYLPQLFRGSHAKSDNICHIYRTCTVEHLDLLPRYPVFNCRPILPYIQTASNNGPTSEPTTLHGDKTFKHRRKCQCRPPAYQVVRHSSRKTKTVRPNCNGLTVHSHGTRCASAAHQVVRHSSTGGCASAAHLGSEKCSSDFQPSILGQLTQDKLPNGQTP